MSGPMSVSMTIKLIDEFSAGAAKLTGVVRELKQAGEEVNALGGKGNTARWDAERDAVKGVVAQVKALGETAQTTGAIDAATAKYGEEASAVRGVTEQVGALNAAMAGVSAPIDGAIAKWTEEQKAVQGVIAEMGTLKAVLAEAATAAGGWKGPSTSGPLHVGGYGFDYTPPEPNPRATEVARQPTVPSEVATATGRGFVDTMVGFAEMATGLKLLRGSFEEASEAAGHNAGMRAAGISTEEASAINTAAERLSRESVFSRNEVVDLARDARTVLGTTHHAIKAMPDIIGLATIAEAQRHGEGQQGVLSLLKGIETSGATTSTEKFHDLAQSIAKVTNVFGKTIDFSAWGQFYKYAGPSAQRMSPEFTEQKLPHLIQELGGASTGTMFQSMNRAMVGQRMDKGAIEEMRRFGLLDVAKVHEDAKGKVKLDAGAVRGSAEFMRDPSTWVTTYLKPAMDAMNLSEEERAYSFGKMFSNHVSERGMSMLENQDANIQKDAVQIRNAQGLEAAPILTRDDPHLAGRAAASRIKDLEQKAGEPVIGSVVGAENAFTSGVGRVTDVLGRIPGAATAFEGALIAGAGYMGWKTWENGLMNTAKGILRAPEDFVKGLGQGVMEGISQAKADAANARPSATRAEGLEPVPETATKAGVGEAAEGLAKVGAAAEAASAEFGAASTSLGSLGLLFAWAAQKDVLGSKDMLKGVPDDRLRRAGTSGIQLPGDIDGHGGASGSWGDARLSTSVIPNLPVTPSVMAAINASVAARTAMQPQPVPTAAMLPQTVTNNEQKYITAPISVTVPVTINATLNNTTPGAIGNTVAGAVRHAIRAGTASLHDGPETK